MSIEVGRNGGVAVIPPFLPFMFCLPLLSPASLPSSPGRLFPIKKKNGDGRERGKKEKKSLRRFFDAAHT